MKVALLHNVNRGQSEHETEFDLPITIDALLSALSKEHITVPIECTRDFTRWISQLILEQPDIVFNVSEGYFGAAREAVVPAICDQLDIPYTGPDATNLVTCHNKTVTKKLLSHANIPMAWGKLIRSDSELESFKAENIPFPVIIKLNSEGSSLGMDENCIVHTWDDLYTQVQMLLKKYKAHVLVEQFIEGIDLSTSFVEGLGTYGPVQYTYPKGSSIYDYRLKSKDNHLVGIQNPVLAESTKKAALNITDDIVKEFGLTGYGRADFRLDEERQQLYFLEMNAQVCFHPDGAFVLSVINNSKYTYDDVVLHIAQYAAKNRVRINSSIIEK